MDNFVAEQLQTGLRYSEQEQKIFLSVYTEACLERSMYEYTGYFPRYFPFIFSD